MTYNSINRVNSGGFLEMKILALISFSLFSLVALAENMKLSCEGHASLKKRSCEIVLSVDTDKPNIDGNLSGTGSIKCFERSGKVIHEGPLSEFCYIGLANGDFQLEAQSPVNPFEVPAQKATVSVDMSSNSKKSHGLARYFNGSVFKEMSLNCEFK